MRIAYVCKRRYMSKDVVLDRYARVYEIPAKLAAHGHQVEAWCLSYRKEAQEGTWTHEAAPGSLVWHSEMMSPAYPWRLLRALRAFKPDIIFAGTDIPHVALGAWLKRKLRVPLIVDLYDNFEGFGQAKIPGFVSLLRRSTRQADLVLTTSEPLRELIVEEYRVKGEVIAMPSTIDRAVFHPRDRAACREALGLPQDALLVGTAGGLNREKGIEALYAAWAILEQRMPNVHLVLAGPHGFPPPTGPRVHSLGPLPHERVAQVFGALDVGAICILDTEFGRYCFPQKAYEMLACDLPVVVGDVGAMHHLFAQTPEFLYRAGDAADLADKLEAQLRNAQRANVPIKDWDQVIAEIEPAMRRLVSG
ncbi:Glycosyl transferase group 1 [Lysobacter dokdonensis DS-58]|uniref:Glycosyl transferase group 1 n=1 Tax=Lysobacter dokdonensis DS-58 TaxID=1300345 RepID=A0A0A2X0T7_9GAMM|nr:glycosyltransferase family 4 protein [Lysobacter dokdonensis]KGQ18854.1 Glycosyl transferase group 1 [Lysobacter dokdonensis DS-58]